MQGELELFTPIKMNVGDIMTCVFTEEKNSKESWIVYDHVHDPNDIFMISTNDLIDFDQRKIQMVALKEGYLNLIFIKIIPSLLEEIMDDDGLV